MTDMKHSDLIEALDGVTAVSKILNIKPPSVSAWKRSGIPDDKLIRLAPVAEQKGVATRFQLFPNPTSSNATVALTIQEASSVELSITDMSGKIMNQRNYGQLSGSYTIDLPTADFPAGIF
jgi:hypothetical protein